MKKLIIIFLTLFILTQNLFSQYDTTKPNIENINQDSIAFNAWFIEIMGNTWSLSFNYDRSLFVFPSIISQYTNLSARIGLGINLYPGHIPFPLMLSLYFGKVHKIELGLGIIYDYLPDKWSEGLDYPRDLIKWTLTLGYRYQKPEGGFVCRSGFTPFFTSKKMYWLWGLSFGYAW